MNDVSCILIQRFYIALNGHNLNALDELVAPDFRHHGIPGVGNLEALKHALIEYHIGFPDLSHTVEDVIADGDRIAVRTVTAGTHTGPFLGHPPSRRRFSAAAVSLYRVDGGLIHEIWEVFDALTMLRQIGLYSRAETASAGLELSDTSPVKPQKPLGYRAGRRPPGPSGEVSLANIRSDPLTFLERLTREHGDYVRYVCDGRETILLNDPKAIRHVLHDRESNYSKLHTPDLLLLGPMLGNGLLTTVGPIWKRDRQWIQAALSGLRMEEAVGAILQVIEGMLLRWRNRSDLGDPLDIVHEMSRLTLEIAARVFFSTDFNSQSQIFGEAMDVLNECMGHSRPGDRDIQDRFQLALGLIRRTVWQTILSRKLYDPGLDDFLAKLLESQREWGDSEQHVVDQAVTILLAGHETTAKALSWTISLLDANPDVLSRLLNELDGHLGYGGVTLNDLRKLDYTRAVIDEALRLRPPIWLLSRTALHSDAIAGYGIPAGALVVISPYLLHRHSRLWENPERFFPDRFLSNEETKQGYRYLPFGHGPRHCVGKTFAMLEMPLVLSTVYSQFTLTLLANHCPEAEALVTLRPRHGLPMVVKSRR